MLTMHRLPFITLFFVSVLSVGSAPIPQYTIQLKRLPDYSLLVPVRVNGFGPFWCALDSGGSWALNLDATPAAQAGLHPDGSGSSAGEGPAVIADQRSSGVTLGLGPLQVSNRTVVIGSPRQEDPSSPYVCIFGTAILDRFVVEVDYRTPTLRVYNSETFRPSPRAVKIAASFENGKAIVPVRLTFQPGQEIVARLLVDTGVPQWPVALSKRFVDEHQILRHVRKIVRPPFQGEATGGAIGLLAARADVLTVGPFRLIDPVMILFRTASGRHLLWDGNLGSEFFRRFTLTLDYPNQRLFLEPNQNYRVPPAPYDGSGLWIRGEPGHFTVKGVLPESPAALAGLEPGDIVLSLDGIATRDLTIFKIRERLYRSGVTCTIHIQRGNEQRIVRMALWPYL